MPDTTTSRYEFVLPEIGSSSDNWGNKLNENFSKLADEIFACSTKAANLSDLTDKNAARTSLGVAIGTNVQAYNAILQAIAAVGTWSSGHLLIGGSGVIDTIPLSTFARTLIDDADAGAMRGTLGLGNVVTYNASTTASGDSAMIRNANGDTAVRYLTSTFVNSTDSAVSSGVTAIMTKAGDDYHRSANASAIRSFLSIANVENKTSETIRAELTYGDVTAALDYVPMAPLGYTPMNNARITYGTAAAGTLAVGDIYLRQA